MDRPPTPARAMGPNSAGTMASRWMERAWRISNGALALPLGCGTRGTQGRHSVIGRAPVARCCNVRGKPCICVVMEGGYCIPANLWLVASAPSTPVWLLLLTGSATVVWWFFQRWWSDRAKRRVLRWVCRCTPVASSKELHDTMVLFGWSELVTDETVIAELRLTNASRVTAHDLKGRVVVKDSIFLTPGWVTDAPDGYDTVWEVLQYGDRLIEIRLGHLNPKQTFVARFVLDKNPPSRPALVMAVHEFTVEGPD